MARGVAYTKHLDDTLKKGIYLTQVPNMDFLYDASTTRNPEYHIGDRVVLPDGRVFRYGKCSNDLDGMKWGCKNHAKLITELDAIGVAAAAGVSEVEITFSDTDGAANDGVIAVDELRGGYISFYRGTARQQRGIVGNTARANGDTTNTTVYLDASLRTAVNENDNVEVIGNPYYTLRQGSLSGGSVMGMPCAVATTGQYFWVQTWGICRITPSGAEIGANNSGERQFVFDDYGSVSSHRVDHDDADNPSWQHAGFLVEVTDSTAGSAAPFINLQINP